MGRRHSIAARKASGDAAKSRIYSIIGKKIQLAAKNGADPKMNPSLEMVLEKARYYGLPRDVIDRAILKGSGQLEGEQLEEVVYEGYGPAGSAFVIKTVTSNTNRTSSNIRTTFTKLGGNMAEIGAVSWQFKEKGFFVIDGISQIVEDKGRQLEKILPFDADELEEKLMELPISDLSIENGVAEVFCEKSDFATVKKGIQSLGFHTTEGDIHFFADNQVSLAGEDFLQLEKLVEALSEDDDVDNVYHNVSL